MSKESFNKLKKMQSQDFKAYYKKSVKNICAIVFFITTTILSFISTDDIFMCFNIEHPSLMAKASLIIVLLFVSLFTAFITCLFCQENKRVLYEKEKCKITVEYGDFNNIISLQQVSDPYTVVIPINNSLEHLTDVSVTKPKSTHGIWLKTALRYYAENKEVFGEVSQRLSSDVLKNCSPELKQTAKVGDCFYIKNIYGVNYLLVVTCTLHKTQSECSDLQYSDGLQHMIEFLSKECDLQEKVYIPIIGGGYAFMNKSNQELLSVMIEMLVYNSNKLQHDIHVVIYDKLKKDIPLYYLNKYN